MQMCWPASVVVQYYTSVLAILSASRAACAKFSWVGQVTTGHRGHGLGADVAGTGAEDEILSYKYESRIGRNICVLECDNELGRVGDMVSSRGVVAAAFWALGSAPHAGRRLRLRREAAAMGQGASLDLYVFHDVIGFCRVSFGNHDA